MNPINLNAFIHHTVSPATISTLKAQCFDLFTGELARISGRTVNVVLHQNVSSMTDFNYKNPAFNSVETLMYRWISAVESYALQHEEPLIGTDRYILVIEDEPYPGYKGISAYGDNSIIASINPKFVIAHEVGHTFWAEHELADTIVDPLNPDFRCTTFMAEGRTEEDCLLTRYSLANEAKIKSFLNEHP